MEAIKIYRYSEERKKWIKIQKRKEIFEKNNYICENCFERKRYDELNIEHDYPCILGGKNIKVLCKKCHNIKNRFDILFINFIKKMNFICSNSYETTFFVPSEDIQELYYKLKKLGKFSFFSF